MEAKRFETLCYHKIDASCSAQNQYSIPNIQEVGMIEYFSQLDDHLCYTKYM